jgi:peptide chain release factor 2
LYDVTNDCFTKHGELAAELVPWVYILNQREALDSMRDHLDGFSEDVLDFEKIIDSLEFKAMMSDKNARKSAILTIHARDGGMEACDWCDMLASMYTKWAVAQDFGIELVSRHSGKGNAGISSMCIEITGSYAYGYLSGENGLHRLVRRSPFNAQGKRQTSFASVQVDPVLPVKTKIILESDLEWDFFIAPGPGGQHKNKTESGVRLTHKPTAVTVTCVTDRSQNTNKANARVMLAGRLARLQEEHDATTRATQRNEKPTVGFGSQIRSYFLHPKQRVIDARTGHKCGNFDAVLDGKLQPFLDAYLLWKAQQGD